MKSIQVPRILIRLQASLVLLLAAALQAQPAKAPAAAPLPVVGFTAFRPELQGRTLRVTGELHETRMDKAYLDKWEARVKAEGKSGGEKAHEEQSPAQVLKQIAGLRERLLKSGQDYSSLLVPTILVLLYF